MKRNGRGGCVGVCQSQDGRCGGAHSRARHSVVSRQFEQCVLAMAKVEELSVELSAIGIAER